MRHWASMKDSFAQPTVGPFSKREILYLLALGLVAKDEEVRANRDVLSEGLTLAHTRQEETERLERRVIELRNLLLEFTHAARRPHIASIPARRAAVAFGRFPPRRSS